MNILLDTHALIWLFEGSPELSEKAKQVQYQISVRGQLHVHVISIATRISFPP